MINPSSRDGHEKETMYACLIKEYTDLIIQAPSLPVFVNTL
jgi:hypothetical protein